MTAQCSSQFEMGILCETRRHIMCGLSSALCMLRVCYCSGVACSSHICRLDIYENLRQELISGIQESWNMHIETAESQFDFC